METRTMNMNNDHDIEFFEHEQKSVSASGYNKAPFGISS